MSPESLCGETHFSTLKRRIAKRFRDGQSEALCCYSSGCNLNLELAKQSLEILTRPLDVEEIEEIRKKAENIARVKKIELEKNAEVLKKNKGEFKAGNGINCYSCNMMDKRNKVDCPGKQMTLYQGSVACRILALSDGSIVQQMVTPFELCSGSR